MKTKEEIAEQVLNALYYYVEDYADRNYEVPDQSQDCVELGGGADVYCDVDYIAPASVHEITVSSLRRDDYPNLSRYIEDYVSRRLDCIAKRITEVQAELYAPCDTDY